MQENNFDLAVNGKFNHSINQRDLSDIDIIEVGKNDYHILKNGNSYRAKIEQIDEKNKTINLKVDQEHFQVSIADNYDKLVEKLGLSLYVTHQVNDIKAPMPGLVLSVEVEEGQEVSIGDTLLVLEAMKMENVIKSPGDGIIKSIIAKKGTPVEKGEILIELE